MTKNRKAVVLMNGEEVGLIEEVLNGYHFSYTKDYLENNKAKSISLTLPLTEKVYTSNHLFSYFFGLLSEGVNKATQCRIHKIDENDHFGLLLATATIDTIGPVVVKEIEE